MGLSKHEEELFKELEGSLNTRVARQGRLGALGIGVLAAGIILLLTGAIAQIVIVGFLGYLVMCVGAYYILTSRYGDQLKGRINARIMNAAQERRQGRRAQNPFNQ